MIKLFIKQSTGKSRFFAALRNPLLWILLLPPLVIGLCSLFLPLDPQAVIKTFSAQQQLENSLKSFKEEILSFDGQDKTAYINERLNALQLQLNESQQQLAYFKNDWGNSLPDIMSNYLARGTVATSDAYFPFYMLIGIGLFFLGLAITHLNAPFFLRAGGLSTGTLITLLAIYQWINVVIKASNLNQKIAGIMMPIVLSIMIGYCWITFFRKFYSKAKI